MKCRHAQIPQRILALLTARPAPPGPSAQEIEWLQAVKACIGALLNLSIDTRKYLLAPFSFASVCDKLMDLSSITAEIASLLYDLRALEILSNILSTYRVASWSASPTSSLALVTALTAEWTINLVKEVVQQEGVSNFEPMNPYTTCLIPFLPSGTDIIYIAPTLCSIITSLPLPNSPGFATSHSPEAEQNDQIYTLVSADLSILTAASELLEARAYNDTNVQEMIAFRPLPENDTATLSYLQGMAAIVESAQILPAWKSVIEEDKANGDDSLEAEKTFSTFKAEIARIIIGVCSNDKVMDDAFKRDSRTSWLLDTCRRWLISGRSDLIITGSTVLANLARKGAYRQTWLAREIQGLLISRIW